METTLRKFLGLLDDGKRVYRFEDGEVDREEFHYSQIMFNYLFDEQAGVIPMLGPTWNMVHDPRFNKIENCFIRRRRKLFSKGETIIGQHVITGLNFFSGDIQSLDQYATILGEGRHFREVLLGGEFKDEDGDPCRPKTFYQESDDTVWRLIRQECPNYFTRDGKPNRDAQNLFNLFKVDLLGLVDDYAEIPLADEMVHVESGEVFEPDSWDGETPVIHLEVDCLEKALNVRGNLRVTAARILERLGFAKQIKEGEQLTDAEMDELLRIVYTSTWPDDRIELARDIMLFITAKESKPFAERQADQLRLALDDSKSYCEKIRSGEIQQINRYTEPGDKEGVAGLDAEAIAEADRIRAIQDNPFKSDLFMILVNAEKAGNSRIAEILIPIFEDANYVVDERIFQAISNQIRIVNEGQPLRDTVTVEGHCDREVTPYWNEEIGATSKLCRKPLPCPDHGAVAAA